MRTDSQKRKIAGQEDKASNHGSVALTANISPKSPSDCTSRINDIYMSEETQLCVTREKMIERVRELSASVLYLPGLNISKKTDL